MFMRGEVVRRDNPLFPLTGSHGFFRVDGGDYYATLPCIAMVLGIVSSDRYLLLVDGVLVTEGVKHMHTWKNL